MMLNVVVQLEIQKFKKSNTKIKPASPYCIEGGGRNCVLMYSNNYRTIGKNLKLILSLDLKRKVELETNELRDKMQFDKKALILKVVL
jgi:hypothetical protein